MHVKHSPRYAVCRFHAVLSELYSGRDIEVCLCIDGHLLTIEMQESQPWPAKVSRALFNIFVTSHHEVRHHAEQFLGALTLM